MPDDTDPPKYTVGSQNFRRNYSKTTNELNSDWNVKNLEAIIANFDNTNDLTTLKDTYATLKDVRKKILGKVGYLREVNKKWREFIDLLEDDTERTAEKDTIDRYMQEKDGEDRIRDFSALDDKYEQILIDVQNSIDLFGKRANEIITEARIAACCANTETAGQPVIVPPPMNDGANGNTANGTSGAPTVNQTDNSQIPPVTQQPPNIVPPPMILSPSVTQQLVQYPPYQLPNSTHDQNTFPQNSSSHAQFSQPPAQYPHSQLQYPVTSQPLMNQHFSQRSDPRQMNPLQGSSRLPTIDLPKFNGDRSRWKVFWQRFNELVHTKSDLLPMDKFAHLHSCLEGGAARLIEAVPQLSEFYEDAIEILFGEYDHDDSFRVQMHRKLKNLRLTSKDPDSLSRYLTDIKAILLQLSYADEVETNRFMISEVLSKFPVSIMKHVNTRFSGNSNYTMKDLLKCITEYLSIERYTYILADEDRQNAFPPYRDKTSERSKPSRTVSPQQNQSFQSENHPAKPASSQSNSSSSSSARRNQCPLCDRPHSNPVNCHTVKSVDDRMKVIREKKLCKKCLLSGHLDSNCTAKCSKCTGTHHAAICQSSHQLSAVAVMNTPNRVRLMTAKVTIENPVTKKRVVCDALLDSGSTVSLMNLSLAQDLGLDLSNSHRTVMTGVNGEAPVKDYPIVNPSIVYGNKKKKQKLDFVAMVQSTPITASLISEELDNNDLKVIQKHRQSINRVHSNRNFVPSILFGIKEYSAIIEKKAAILPSGYVLYKSILGPIVAGGSSLDTVSVNVLTDVYSN